MYILFQPRFPADPPQPSEHDFASALSLVVRYAVPLIHVHVVCSIRTRVIHASFIQCIARQSRHGLRPAVLFFISVIDIYRAIMEGGGCARYCTPSAAYSRAWCIIEGSADIGTSPRPSMFLSSNAVGASRCGPLCTAGDSRVVGARDGPSRRSVAVRLATHLLRDIPPLTLYPGHG